MSVPVQVALRHQPNREVREGDLDQGAMEGQRRGGLSPERECADVNSIPSLTSPHSPLLLPQTAGSAAPWAQAVHRPHLL